MGFLKYTAVSKYFVIKFIKYSLFENIRKEKATVKNGNEISSFSAMDCILSPPLLPCRVLLTDLDSE